MTQPRRKKALITGITGQDGSYLAEALLAKDYDVYGIIRRSSSFNTNRIDHIYQDPHVVDSRLHLTFGDLNDASSLNKIMRTLRPDEMYNLGAQSHVRVSFDIPEYTAEVTGIGTLRLLEAIRESGIYPKFYQASSSEMFGKAQDAHDFGDLNDLAPDVHEIDLGLVVEKVVVESGDFILLPVQIPRSV